MYTCFEKRLAIIEIMRHESCHIYLMNYLGFVFFNHLQNVRNLPWLTRKTPKLLTSYKISIYKFDYDSQPQHFILSVGVFQKAILSIQRKIIYLLNQPIFEKKSILSETQLHLRSTHDCSKILRLKKFPRKRNMHQ